MVKHQLMVVTGNETGGAATSFGGRTSLSHSVGGKFATFLQQVAQHNRAANAHACPGSSESFMAIATDERTLGIARGMERAKGAVMATWGIALSFWAGLLLGGLHAGDPRAGFATPTSRRATGSCWPIAPYAQATIPEPYQRHIVDYHRKEAPGTIVVDPMRAISTTCCR